MKKAILALLTFACCFTLSYSEAKANWQEIGQFPSPISCVMFTSPEVGFVGLGLGPGGILGQVGIFKTLDAGKTWIETQIPQGYTGDISQILMIDDLNGWAGVIPWKCSKDVGLWRTTDGGLTWNETSVTSGITSLYQTSTTFVATDIFSRGHLSFDSGRTWTGSFLSSTNCVDFVDDLHGVISDYRGQNWLVTSDGGKTWSNSNITTEAWSVYGIKGTGTFYAAPEGPSDGTPYSTQIMRSSDFGLNWDVVNQFDFRTTGTILGAGEDVLYVQTGWNNNKGGHTHDFYCSIDHGTTWSNIGGPGTFGDSRFMVYGGTCEGVIVYAFDSVGGLYRFIDEAFSQRNDRVQSHSIGTKHVAANSTISIPVGLSLPSNRLIDTMQVEEIDYTLLYNGDLLDVDAKHLLSRITPPAGWSVIDASIASGTISLRLGNTNSQTLTNSILAGSILFDTYAGKEANTLISIGSFVIRTKNKATYFYCTGFEGDYLGLVVIEGSGVESQVADHQLSIYPNPVTNGTLTLIYNSKPNSRAEIEFVDLLGRSVLEPVTVSPSRNEIQLNVQSLIPGNYYLRMRSAGNITTRKFTVFK